jgi:hypothetical protein
LFLFYFSSSPYLPFPRPPLILIICLLPSLPFLIPLFLSPSHLP